MVLMTACVSLLGQIVTQSVTYLSRKHITKCPMEHSTFVMGEKERKVILSADQLLEAESLQIGASIVASRGPELGLGPVHKFSIQFNSI